MMTNRCFRRLTGLLVLAALVACHTNVDEFVPNPDRPDPGKRFRGRLFMEARPAAQVFTLSADTDTVLTTPAGVQVELRLADWQRTDGGTAPTPVRAEVHVLTRPGDWLRFRHPTTDAEAKLLAAGGQLAVRLTQDNVPLALRPGAAFTYRFPTARTDWTVRDGNATTLPDFTTAFAWTTGSTIPTVTDWTIANSSYTGLGWPGTSAAWQQLSRTLPTTTPTTEICVELRGHAATEAVVFAYFPGRPALAELYETDVAGTFCYAGAPLTDSVHYLAIAEPGLDSYAWAIKSETVAAGNPVVLDPQPLTLAALLTQLNNL